MNRLLPRTISSRQCHSRASFKKSFTRPALALLATQMKKHVLFHLPLVSIPFHAICTLRHTFTASRAWCKLPLFVMPSKQSLGITSVPHWGAAVNKLTEGQRSRKSDPELGPPCCPGARRTIGREISARGARLNGTMIMVKV